ncbi:hypothetical protein MNBD_GAMMA05-1258 [hydrothermal vent metagenome]|uniref:Glycosyltransferase RgtA/B/C/D-like domain-containing protein n=1 Tax=hydrothermal vent metagenome TaxID=652676 RepID=A0A3B0XAD7_9ZZZZ
MPSLAALQNPVYTRLFIYLIIVISIGFHISTIRTGHHWEGDFALYTAHAKNIADGHNYSDTGYIFNPEQPFLAPKSYPPVYPVFLAPIYKLFGLNILAMKIANILIFAVFLLLFQHYIRKRLRYPVTQIAIITAVAFGPWFWIAKDRILPDFLFMTFIYGSVLLVDQLYEKYKPTSRSLLLTIVIGLTIYLAYGTRSLGLVLLPTLLLFDVVRTRWISKSTIVILAIFSTLYLTQNFVLQTDKSYLNTFKTSLQEKNHNTRSDSGDNNKAQQTIEINSVIQKSVRTIFSNAKHYHQSMAAYWSSNINNTIDNTVYISMGLLAIIGFVSVTIKRPSFADYLFFVYISLILLVPFRMTRYLLPIIPLYLFYIFYGFETILNRSSIQKKYTTIIFSTFGLLLIVVLSYIGSYSKHEFNHIENGVTTKESQALFNFIRQNTPEDSTFISRKPRLIALFANRDATIYAWKKDGANLLNYFSDVSATHIVVAKENSGVSEIAAFRNWVANNSNKFYPIYENSDFLVYRIR